MLKLKVMIKTDKKILIIDEVGFCRICAAILEKEGFETLALSEAKLIPSSAHKYDYGLIITSYPFAEQILPSIREMNVPTILLLDCLNAHLTRMLDNFGCTLFHCMVKPLDYMKFRDLVKEIMHPKGAGIHLTPELGGANNVVAQSRT